VLTPVYHRSFERDLTKMLRRGKDPSKIKSVMRELIEQRPLAEKHRDHKLLGNYRGRRECHIEPDWLLIYLLEASRIIFERTGAHADLFR